MRLVCGAQFTWFLATFPLPLGFLALVWPVVWYRDRVARVITPGAWLARPHFASGVNLWPAEMKAVPGRLYATIGFFDFASTLLAVIPAPFVPGPVAPRPRRLHAYWDGRAAHRCR